MAEAFKEKVNEALVREMSSHLVRCSRAFRSEVFEREALQGLGKLELKERVAQVSRALEAALPLDFSEASSVLEAALAPARLDDDLSALSTSAEGLAGWCIWPMTDFVARCGQGHLVRSLQTLHALTQRFSSEFALRFFLASQTKETLVLIAPWVRDPSPHVRRLVSEGTRPRLPWGMRLECFIEDPRACLPLLEELAGDPSDYVRRSVANHLNDIGKDHPALAVEFASRLLERSPGARPLVSHALRSLVKKGHPGALVALGFSGAAKVRLSGLVAKPKRIRIGSTLCLGFTLSNRGRSSAELVVDYAVHYLRARGGHGRKVFKGRRLSLGPGESKPLELRHRFLDVSIRKHNPGLHRVEVLVNGRSLGLVEVRLLA